MDITEHGDFEILSKLASLNLLLVSDKMSKDINSKGLESLSLFKGEI